MTFDYLNHVFNLPPDYFKTALVIKDSHYPRLTITRYARKNKLDPAIFLKQVQTATQAALTPPQP